MRQDAQMVAYPCLRAGQRRQRRVLHASCNEKEVLRARFENVPDLQLLAAFQLLNMVCTPPSRS
jgi:hypothetical protein